MKTTKKILSYLLIVMLAFGSVITTENMLGTNTVWAAKKVKLSKTSATVCVGKSLKLSLSGTKEKVIWSVDKKKIASVSKSGKVTPKKTGKVVVKATVGKKSYTCTVKVVKHSYSKATCTKPATCKYCESVKGKTIAHKVVKHANCVEDGLCATCKKVIEKATGEHDYQPVKCGEPKECVVCHAKSDVIAQHEKKADATCTEAAVCKTCGTTLEEAKGHDYQTVKCEALKECSVCHEKSDQIAEHVKKVICCTEDIVCELCGIVLETAKGHDFADATCTEGKKCKVCGVVEGGPLGHNYVTSTVEPTPSAAGYTEDKCSNCGDSKKYNYVEYVAPPVDENSVAAAIMAMQSQYPEGTSWTNEGNSYVWKAIPNTRYTGHGCAAFTIMMSDVAVGTTRTATKHSLVGLSADQIKACIRLGDIIRTDNDTHEVIVIGRYDGGVIVAEGNYNHSVHWGREISYEELASSAVYYWTRY